MSISTIPLPVSNAWTGGVILHAGTPSTVTTGTTPVLRFLSLLNASHYVGSDVVPSHHVFIALLFFILFIITVYIRIVVVVFFKRGQYSRGNGCKLSYHLQSNKLLATELLLLFFPLFVLSLCISPLGFTIRLQNNIVL